LHPSNDYYGQEMMLSWAASIHRPKRTFGYIQHGWKPEASFPVGMRLLPGARLFVWSEHNQRATAQRFRRHRVEAIGAPFLYLYEMMKPSLDRAPTQDLLVYPCHQLRGAPLPREVHDSLIAQVLELAAASITVNLHPYEAADATISGLYAARLPNATITTNWLRAPWVVSDDPTILIRQILQILDHRRVVSNCLTTALLYAAHLGRDARLLLHPARRPQTTEGRGKALHEELERAEDGSALAAFAQQALGTDQMRDPDELRAVMGWDSRARSVVASLVRSISLARGQ